MNGTKKATKWLWTSIILMLISMIGASMVQTSFYRVTVKDLRWMTSQGYMMSGLLFIPKGVSAENKAPAIVTSHGMFNNREMQDLNFVELARRGYVVLSMDMYSHGHSDPVPNIGILTTGMYEAVKMIASLNFVDASRIGITGHSLGGMSSNTAVQLDNAAPERLISAVLLNSADAVYKDEATGQYVNIYGSRDVGIVAVKYEEFFMRDVDDEGRETLTRDFVRYGNAQSFLHFGKDPAGLEQRSADTIYRETVDGEEAIRVIYNPAIIHPWSHFSKRSTVATIQFFDAALGAPNPIPAGNQIWQLKEFFNAVGLVGFAIFIVSFATILLRSGFFASLRAEAPVSPISVAREGKGWFWSMLVLSAAFGTILYIPLLTGVKSFTFFRDPWPQSQPWGIGLWAFYCGLFAIVLMLAYHFLAGRRNGFKPLERGVAISWTNLGKTVLLALAVFAASYAWVFVADYFFKTDFRLWTLAVKAFGAEKLGIALFPYAPLFLVYFLATSVAVNSFNHNTVGTANGKRGWGNVAILAVANTLPAVIILCLQYFTFFSTGEMMFRSANMPIVWLFPFLVILPATTVIARKLYLRTNNPYLPGLINGLIVTVISCTNTLTWS